MRSLFMFLFRLSVADDGSDSIITEFRKKRKAGKRLCFPVVFFACLMVYSFQMIDSGAGLFRTGLPQEETV